MNGEKKFDKFSISNEKEAKLIENKLNNQNFFLDSLDKKEKKRNPYSPFSNSLLLQDASSKLGFSPKQTNSLAQELKDGIGSLGALITYHRSDSNKMKNTEINKLREMIKKITEKILFQKILLTTRKGLNLFSKDMKLSHQLNCI